MEAGWFAHATVRPDAVLFVRLVICGRAVVGVVVVPEELPVVEVLLPDEVFVVGVMVVAAPIVKVTGNETMPPLEMLTDTVVV